MKYTIYEFNQAKAIEFELDITDLLILNYIRNFYPRMLKKQIEDKNGCLHEYVWFNYGSFIEEYPILKIEKNNTISKRLWNMAKNGLILKYCERNKKGSFSYVSLTDKFFELISDSNITISPENQDQFSKNTGGIDFDKNHHLDFNQEQNNPVTKYNPTTTPLNTSKNMSDKNLEFLKYSERLKKYVEERKRKSINKKTLDNWNNTFRLLAKDLSAFRNKDEIEQSIDKVFNYLENENDSQGQYKFVVESADSFREKFTKIEDKIMKKETYKPNDSYNKNNKINYAEMEKYIL